MPVTTLRRIIWPTLGLFVLAFAVLGGMGWYEHEYYRSPWQSVPTQVSACGRDYIDPSRAVTLSAASRSPGAAPSQVSVTGGWPRSEPIFARRMTGSSWVVARCGVEVFVQTSPDQYVPYGLSGGP